jgi:hypothetical protein
LHPSFPDLLASGVSTREAIGEGHEVVDLAKLLQMNHDHGERKEL